MNFKNIVLVAALLIKCVDCTDTTCEDSQKHFAILCFAPTPATDFDPAWGEANQPKEGWHIKQGNDIARLHLTEVLKGKLLTLQDNFEDGCLRIRNTNTEGEQEGIYGYGNLTANWNCTESEDNVGVLMCDMKSSGPSTYHENFNNYISYSDNNNVSVAIYCFPNGQVGWAALSVSQNLSEEEEKAVSDHIKSIGFSEDNTVSMHGNSCAQIE